MESVPKKTIWDYFDDTIDYPKEVIHNPIPYGTVWNYIASTYLNGIVNYAKPLKLFVVDRYTARTAKIGGSNVTKQKLMDSFITGNIHRGDWRLSAFEDDIILLGKVETDTLDDVGRYVFFYFDRDVSDCSVGKFETSDSEEEVMQSLYTWLDSCVEAKKYVTISGDMDNGIINYTELPLSFLVGWISF